MPTHTRREIRQAAIQFLYCYHLEGGTDTEEVTEAFWEILLEDDFVKLTKASVKSVLHLNQGRQKRYHKLGEAAPALLEIIATDKEAKKLATALTAILRSESKWQTLLDRMNRIYNPKLQEAPADLCDTLKEVYLLNDTLKTQRQQWDQMLADNPKFKDHAESISASIAALARVSDRIFMVANPTSFPTHTDVKHLIGTAEKMTTFKEAVNTSAELVTKNKDAIDAKINDVVENYKPERINPVDKAILRLAAAEILFNDDIPTAVAINEAIEIANRFSSSDSAKFINGVLDKLAKTVS